jgi:hypothetical protein
MIVRIATEDQYEIPNELYEQLNDLDNAVVEAVDRDDEQAYDKRFAELLDFIRSNGKPLPGDDLHQSDVIIPPPDTTLAEAEAEFTGEGLIPESVVADTP